MICVCIREDVNFNAFRLKEVEIGDFVPVRQLGSVVGEEIRLGVTVEFLANALLEEEDAPILIYV